MEFALLGPVEARTGGRCVEIGHARQRCVLAVLLIEANQSVPADRLIERVWGDEPPRSVRNVLSGYLTRLRAALSESSEQGVLLARTAAGYRMSVPEDAVDLHRFRRLVVAARAAPDDDRRGETLDEALRLWRGSPFCGLSSPWLDAVRRTLENERIAALIERNDVALRQGRARELLADLAEETATWPLNESLARQQMIALHRSGRSAEALDRFERIRRRLAAELGADPAVELRRVHEQILRHDPDLDLADRRAARPSRVIPRQLPHAVSNFTGRQAELDTLQRFAGSLGELGGQRPAWSPAMVISALDGAAGVGKTALAIRFAHQIADRFPDGQLYVNLRGFDPTDPPLAPGEALIGFLRALGVDPRQIPSDLDSQAGLYRSVLAGQRILVILDNAATAEQVSPLLPGTGACAVIVTSRNRLSALGAGHGARLLTLGMLEPAQAMTLLARVAGPDRVARESAAAADIARLCGLLPLALRICGEHLAAHPHLKLSELAERLACEHGRLDVLTTDDGHMAIRASLSLSYRGLTAEVAALFRLLGLHPGTEFSVGSIAAVAGADVAVARGRAQTLSQLHLVDEIEADRYRMHDLIRVYAAERAAEEDTAAARHAATQRLLSWYLHSADAAGAVLRPQRPRMPLGPPVADCHPAEFASFSQALDWCERERVNLVPATRMAAAIGDHLTASQLPSVLVDYFFLRKPWPEWITTHEIGLESAQVLGNSPGVAGMLTGLGVAYNDIRRSDDAIDCLEQALPHWRRIGFTLQEAFTHYALGAAYRETGRHTAALGQLEHSLSLFRKLASEWGQGVVLRQLGETYRNLRRFDEAIVTLDEALAICRDSRDRYGVGCILHELGSAYLDLERPGNAVDNLRKALAIRRETADRQGEARTLRALGHAYRALGQTSKGRSCLRESLALLEDLSDPRSEAVAGELASWGGAP